MVSVKADQAQVQRRAFRRLGNLVFEGYSQPRIATLSVAEPSTSASGAQLPPAGDVDRRPRTGAHISG